MIMKRSARIFFIAAGISIAVIQARAAEETLATARDLYSAAAYDEALAVLDRLRAGSSSDDPRSIDQYRAFCLLALGRAADADRAIEAVVSAEPSYQPSDADVSPRIRSAFRDVRKRMLPGIVQQAYASAKAAYDRKEFAAAESSFRKVLDFFADPDLAQAGKEPPLSDLRTLATGFHDLSKAAMPPPVLPAAPPPAVAASRTAVQIPRPPAPPRIYGPDDLDVVPPTAIKQVVPAFQFQTAMQPPPGALEIVIDERGLIESAAMRKPIFSRYDVQVLDATKTWQYMPATLNGIPVKYRKLVNITVKK
jgi:hypothetical protein